MKLLGILWNSIGEKRDEATEFIRQYSRIVEIIDINLKDDYEKFLRELYPFNEMEKWKADYKVKGLVNKYKDNNIRIILLESPKTEKVFLKNKNKMIYKNILELKVSIRRKYNYLIVNDEKIGEKNYDNVFHMTDDEEEYDIDIKVVYRYVEKYLNRQSGFVDVKNWSDMERVKLEKYGTRKKFWLNTNMLFKSNAQESYECFSEIFNMYLLRVCGFDPTYYDLAYYNNEVGVITLNVLSRDEYMVDGSHIMSEDESFTKKELIEHNNIETLEQIIRDWCNRKELVYNSKVIEDLEKLFVYDLLTLQPDRNPSNYAIAVNKNTKEIRLVFFDNSNMLFFDSPTLIQKYKNNQLDIDGELLKLKTFLMYKNTDTCFDDKVAIFERYYSSISDEKREYVKFILNNMDCKTIHNIFVCIENDKKIKLPDDFKKAIFEAFKIHHTHIYQKMEKIDELHNKQLKLKK